MATLYVGTSEGYYSTVTDAVAAAKDGDTIIVRGSEYTLTNEAVNVSKALTIQAEGNVTVDSFAIGTGKAKPQNIVIEGFTIKPSANRGIYQAGTNVTTLTVKDCTFDLTEATATGYGIHLDLNFSGTEKVTVDVTGIAKSQLELTLPFDFASCEGFADAQFSFTADGKTDTHIFTVAGGKLKIYRKQGVRIIVK